jgi:lauroyl/myristoyl acyltransferase
MLGVLLAEALDRGEMVAIQGDRPRAGGRIVATTLFGRPFDVPAGPAALARTARVPLLPGRVHVSERKRFESKPWPPSARAGPCGGLRISTSAISAADQSRSKD